MANFFIPILALTLLLPSLLSSPSSAGDDSTDIFVRPLDRKTTVPKKEKFSHFCFYWHDVATGQNRSSVTVLPPVNASTTAFGAVNMIEIALTTGPDPTSKLVGRAQGFYAFSSQEEVSLLMAMNFAFTAGKYDGSAVTVIGRNPTMNKWREMPVIGGSRLFRFASGYAKLTTYSLGPTGINAVVEYNVYVKHY